VRRVQRAVSRAFAAVLLAALLVAGCGGTSAPPNTVRVGYAFGTDAGDTGDLLAYEQLKDAGLTVKVSSTGSLENAVSALSHGSVDVAVLTQPALIAAVSQGADLEAIVAQNMVAEGQLVERGTGTVADLKGQRVAVGKGGSGPALVTLATRAAGLPAGSIRVRVVPESTARAVGLRQGRLRAAQLDASDVLRLRASMPDIHVLARLSDYGPVTGQLVFVTRPAYARDHDRLLRTFVAGILGASDTLYGPGGRAAFTRVALANALEGEGAALAGSIYDYYRSVGMWPRASRPITCAQYARTASFFRETGQVESSLPFDRVWNLAYWRS
jgi:ABC-type nitrate/sulfonate/bicarbonate transport system substrate-binding protein